MKLNLTGLLSGINSLPGTVLGSLLGPLPENGQLGLDPAQVDQARKQAINDMAMGLLAAPTQSHGANLAWAQTRARENYSGRMVDLLREQELMRVNAVRKQQDQAAMEAALADKQLAEALVGTPVPEELGMSQQAWDALPPKDKVTLLGQYRPRADKFMSVSPGATVIDPQTGQAIYHAPESPEPPRAAQEQQPPSGYMWVGPGQLAPIPGGPADLSGPGATRHIAPLRKEFKSLESVKSFETALPLLVSAREAPDTGYGDLQLIYTVGKVLDPGSVVREGELDLTIQAGSPIQRIIGTTRFTAEKGGRLTPSQRKQLLDVVNERTLAYRKAYDQDRETYSEYASNMGIPSDKVIGPHPANAYKKKAPQATAKSALPALPGIEEEIARRQREGIW